MSAHCNPKNRPAPNHHGLLSKVRRRLAVLGLVALAALSPMTSPTALAEEAAAKEATEAATADRVNVNTAPADDLALLPRVGPAVAARIIEFREANGDFETIADLMLVRGVGEKTFALLEPYVAVDGETTLRTKVRLPKTSTHGSGGDR